MNRADRVQNWKWLAEHDPEMAALIRPQLEGKVMGTESFLYVSADAEPEPEQPKYVEPFA